MSSKLIDWRPPGPVRNRMFLGAGVLVLAVVWECAGRSSKDLMFPPLTKILMAALDSNNQRVLEAAALATVPDIGISFALGGAVGIGSALVGSIVPFLMNPLQRSALFLSTLPLIVLAPVLVTLLGVDRVPMAIGVLASFFPIFTAAASGFCDVQPTHISLISTLGGRRIAEFRFVRWPSALLMIADALQLSALYATFGVLFGEWFGTDNGLGVLLLTSMQNYQVELLWLTALSVTIFSHGVALLIGSVSRLAMKNLLR
jgi:ABC-type nitrate/sulfonate/bicarbonate transport system permease component